PNFMGILSKTETLYNNHETKITKRQSQNPVSWSTFGQEITKNTPLFPCFSQYILLKDKLHK
ncbi:MAG: hypothetical protein JSV83_02815, partial [Desulfobacterales bacterium]